MFERNRRAWFSLGRNEVYISWMAGFHPEKKVEWYKLFLNDEVLTNEVRF